MSSRKKSVEKLSLDAAGGTFKLMRTHYHVLYIPVQYDKRDNFEDRGCNTVIIPNADNELMTDVNKWT